MKLSITIFIVCFFLFTGCNKDKSTPVSPTLQLIQHDWNVISARIFFSNGSNYKLLNDKQSFRKDNLQITQVEGVGSISYDTSKYVLLSNDSTLLFYSIQNGVQSSIPDTAFIKTINDNLFVYYFQENGFNNFIDSLKR